MVLKAVLVEVVEQLILVKLLNLKMNLKEPEELAVWKHLELLVLVEQLELGF